MISMTTNIGSLIIDPDASYEIDDGSRGDQEIFREDRKFFLEFPNRDLYLRVRYPREFPDLESRVGSSFAVLVVQQGHPRNRGNWMHIRFTSKKLLIDWPLIGAYDDDEVEDFIARMYRSARA